MRPVSRVLIANRGEIARRIIRACHEEGLEAVAVYSEADRHSLHVRAADFAMPIGAAAPTESYLRIDRLIEAARQSGAQAIHPGYGFLAERAEFAEAVIGAGLGFVGPGPDAMRALGDKTEARQLMARAGVPIVPGTTEPLTSAVEAERVAGELGYPVMVKAAAGGGGKGMRVVASPKELGGAIETARSEARKAFGDDAVYLEKFIVRPRHVEVQILADGSRTIHLNERECSIQRRHQKLVEESPSVAVSAELRERMGQAAVAAAQAVGYVGAGTCEFLLAEDGSFYFLEMNTRIQVEHPVTEMVLGVDLVREQLRIVRGLPMTPGDGPHAPAGWAIECRITSEDPAHGFLPSTGRIRFLRAPSGPGVRWDGGVETGDEVTLFYDSLLGKLIVWAPDRTQAIRRMLRALSELIVLGVGTNQGFHRRLLSDPSFQAGDIDIQFLDRRPDLLTAPHDPHLVKVIALAAALAEDEARRSRAPAVSGAEGHAQPSAWIRAARRDALQ